MNRKICKRIYQDINSGFMRMVIFQGVKFLKCFSEVSMYYEGVFFNLNFFINDIICYIDFTFTRKLLKCFRVAFPSKLGKCGGTRGWPHLFKTWFLSDISMLMSKTTLSVAHIMSRVLEQWKLFCFTGHSLTADDKSKKIVWVCGKGNKLEGKV